MVGSSLPSILHLNLCEALESGIWRLVATYYLQLANRYHPSTGDFFIFPIDILKFICYFETVIGVISQLQHRR